MARFLEIGLLVGPDKDPVAEVSEDETVETAAARMTSEKYSQLPVSRRDGKHGLLRAEDFVSHLSAIRGASASTTLYVREFANGATAQLADVRDDLFDWFERLAETDAVLVCREGNPFQIVTNYDVLRLFQRIAEDFIWIRETETTLQEHVKVGLGEYFGAVLQEASDAEERKIDKVEDLGLRSLVGAILDTRFTNRFTDLLAVASATDLKRLVDLRNTVCHFRGPLSQGGKAELKAIRDRVRSLLGK